MSESLISGGGKVACIGEVMIELIAGAGTDATLGVAGDTYNSAVYLAKLLHGSATSVSYITNLGVDAFSDRILAHMQMHGIDQSAVQRRADKSVGLYAIETDDAGERRFSYWRSDSAARTLFEENAKDPSGIVEKLSSYELVFLSGISLAVLPVQIRDTLFDAIDKLRARGTVVAFDSNYRPSLWDSRDAARGATEAMWKRCDIALPSLDDEIAIFGDADEAAVLARHRSYGYALGALKRGERGPKAIQPEIQDVRFEAATNVIDTTAAGDSFNAGFLAAALLGEGVEASMRRGHELASRVVASRGAIIDI